jgi:hypothetical protein
MLILTHLICCGFYWVGSRYEDRGWVARDNIAVKTLPQRYTRAFHFGVSLFFGETLILPQSTDETIFTIVALILFFIVQIWFVSSITTAMTRVELISTKRSADVVALGRYMSENNVSSAVAVKVHRNAQHALEEQVRNAPERSIALLKLISQPLMMDLHFEIYFPRLCVHPFFRCYNLVNHSGIRQVCHQAIKTLDISKDDILFSDLESPPDPRVLFVLAGFLEYVQQEGKETTRTQKVQHGYWISEGLLWIDDWLHCGMLRATSDCKVLALDARMFQTIIAAAASDHARQYAEQYVKHINEERWITDISFYRPKDKTEPTTTPNRNSEERSSLAASKTADTLGSVKTTGSMAKASDWLSEAMEMVFDETWEQAQLLHGSSSRAPFRRQNVKCGCGNMLMDDAHFCRKCGAKV